MDTQSKFLPDSVAGALKSLVFRGAGAALMVVGIWLTAALIFHDPYLDGFAAAGTLGRQGIMGNIVGAVRYLIGFVPAMFVFLCMARRGLVMLAGWRDDNAPEYNFMRGFIAVAAGAAGFGMIMPSATFGGLAGAVAAADMTALIGGWAALVGMALVGVFFVLGGVVLHVKWAHVRALLSFVWRAVRWVLSVFHLTRPVVAAPAPEETDDAAEPEEDEEEEASAPAAAARRPRTRAIKRRAVAARTAAGPAEYELPPPELLEASNFSKTGVTAELKRVAVSLEDHFEEFGVYGKVVGIKPGPIVTLFEFEPDTGVRIAKITETVKDMTRAMATESMRIAHIPGTPYLGVEMVNLNRQTVRYREIIADSAFVESKYKIPLALGVNIGGKPMYYDLAKMPHMLVAGRTGSGKSVFIQSLITSIVYHFTPDKCKLMIIDPKGVDFDYTDCKAGPRGGRKCIEMGRSRDGGAL